MGQTKEYKKYQGTQPCIYEKMLELAKMAQLWRVVTQSCAIFGSRSTTRIYEMGSHIYDMAYKSNRISSCNLFVYFAQKNYFFYFIHQFLQNTYISLSILHIYSIKYSFFCNFLLFPHSLPFSLTYPTLSKNTKILNARTTATMHICTITVAL